MDVAIDIFPAQKGSLVLRHAQATNPRRWIRAQQPHSGLQVGTTHRYLTPMEAVHASLRYGNPARVLSDPTLALRLLPTKLLQPQDDGVTWEKRRYWCENYKDLIAASTARGKRRKLVFFYDPQAKHRLYWIEPGTFNVRRLSSPGADSGVQPAFDGVRRMIADTLGQTGQPWPTHTQIGERRADLVELMHQSWDDDGINPAENVVPLRPPARRAKRKKSDQETQIDNGGWRLEDFDLDPADLADGAGALRSAAAEWDAGIIDDPDAAPDGWVDLDLDLHVDGEG